MEPSNFILIGSACQYHWKGAGLFSIKTFQGGPAYYSTGKGHFKVDEDHFLLLNEGTNYSIQIDHEKKVDSFCLFFDPATVKEACFGWGKNPEYLLDNLGHYEADVSFIERTYPSTAMENRIQLLKSGCQQWGKDPIWLEQEFFQLFTVLRGVYLETLRERERLTFLRSSTRQELYERLLKAREYIHYHWERPLTLQEIAREATLSINHLIRNFKAVFHLTPHAYLNQRRLAHARREVLRTDKSIQAICEEVGFSSLGSFSLFFKKHLGCSPETFRARNR